MGTYLDGLYGWVARLIRGYNALWVIVHRLSKLTQFIAVKDTTSTNQLGKIYVGR